MKILRTLAFASGLALLSGAALAHGYKVGPLEIGHPWSRATPKSAPVGGGYFTVTNTGKEADRLISVQSDASKRVELHEMKMEDGVMKMRAVDGGLPVPAGGKLELTPSGYHVMFIDLAAPFVTGSSFKGRLVFEKAGSVDVEFQVEAMSTKTMDHSAMPHMDHSGMKPMGR